MKKVIGITASRRDPLNAGQHRLNMKYAEVVMEAGFTPVIVPVGADPVVIAKIVDGMIFSGGADIHPYFYNENVNGTFHPDMGRDRHELALYKEMIKAGKPILGICRGLQLILVAEDFALNQDLEQNSRYAYLEHHQDIERTYPSHFAYFDLSSGSLLGVYKYETKRQGEKRITISDYADGDLIPIFAKKWMVNSMHHQGLHITEFRRQYKNTKKNVKILAMAEDGVIEAIKVTGYESRILAVQFHPEETKDIKLVKEVFA